MAKAAWLVIYLVVFVGLVLIAWAFMQSLWHTVAWLIGGKD